MRVDSSKPPLAPRVIRSTIAMLLLCVSLSAQTTVTIPAASGAGVKLTTERFGVNIAQEASYGGSQMLRNLLGNATAELAPPIWQTSSICTSSCTGTTWQDTNYYSVAPANFYVGATYQTVSGSCIGSTGTVTASTAANGPSNIGIIFTLSPGVSGTCSGGDNMILRCTTPSQCSNITSNYTIANAGYQLHQVGGGTVAFETSDLDPASASLQAIQVSAGGGYAGVGINFDGLFGPPVSSPSLGTAISLNGTYTLSFLAKGTSGSPSLNYQVIRQGGTTFLNANQSLPVNATPGAGWSNYSYTFTANETNNGSLNYGFINLNVSGGNAIIEDPRLVETATASGNTTAFRDAFYDKLVAMKVGILRYMDPSTWGCTFANMLLTVPNGCNYSVQAQYPISVPINLNDFFYLNAVIGSDPWWTMSPYTTPAEMANIAAYLNAPCSSGNSYATIRCNFLSGTAFAGMTWPQASAVNGSGNIYLEFGNEVWNDGNNTNLKAGAGQAYGTLVGTNMAALTGATYYNSKIKFVASGFEDGGSGSGSWNDNVLHYAQTAGQLPSYIDCATYNFSVITDTSSNANIFNPMWANLVNLNTLSTGQIYQCENWAYTHYGVNALAYESNTGGNVGISGVSQSTINQASSAVGSGLDTALELLLSARDAGFAASVMFQLPGPGDSSFYTASSASAGSYSQSSTLWSPFWGMNLYWPGPGNTGTVDRPTAITEQVVNQAIGNNLKLLNTSQSGTPTFSSPLAQPDPSQGVQFTANCDGTTNISNISITAGSFFGYLPQYIVGTTGVSNNTLWSSYNAGAHTGVLAANCASGSAISFQAVGYSVAANASVPYVQAFGFGDGAGDYSAIVFNTDLTNSHAITWAGAGAPTGSCTRTLFGGAQGYNITDNNEGVAPYGTPVVAVPASTTYAGCSAGDTLAPYTMATYTWSTAAPSTTAAVTSSLNPSLYGQPVTFTATLTGTSAAPTGSVTFVDGSTPLATATLTVTGALTSTATYTTSALPQGPNSITVTYPGGTTSPVLSQVVNPDPPPTASVTSSQNPTIYGQSTTLTATLTGNYAAPTGPVVFMDGATAIATVSLTAGGGLSSTAALTTSTLPVGTDPITAYYAATADFGAATSPAVSQAVNPGSTTATVASSLSPSSYGQSVTLTATLTGNYAAPTGSVTFKNGGTTIGTGTLNPTGGLTSTATLITTTLPVGTGSITAVYAATANFTASTSPAISQVVNADSTTAAVASSLSPSSSGQSVTLTATLSSAYAAPTGSVTFMSGGTSLGSATLTPGSGLSSTATLASTTLPLGTDSLTVIYAATSNFGASTSPAISQVVNTDVTAAAVTSSLNPAAAGQSVTLTATVASAYASPSGSVTFMDGATAIGTVALTSTGSLTSNATLTTTALPAGTDPITVVYAASGNFAATTSPALSQVVNAGSTTAAVASSANPASAGQTVTLTATVSSSTAPPTGSVVFMDGATAIGTVTLVPGSGLSSTATLNTATLPIGTDAITAVYAATANFGAATSPALSVVVNPAATTATLTSSLNPAGAGQSVTLSATVSSGFAAPTGTVLFKNGATLIGSATLAPGSGLSSTAAVTTSALPVGTDSITVSYAATGNFAATVSSALSQVVNAAATTAAVASSASPSSEGQSVTFTATVSSGSAAPTGSVTFMNGATSLGSATLTPGSGLSSTATLPVSTLPVGTDAITVVYAATANFAASTSPVFNQTVNAAGTTAAVASSPGPSSYNQPVTLTATVSSGFAAPTGSVTFMYGATSLGIATLVPGSGLSSTATLATSTLPVGSDSITAVYAATANFSAATSPALTQVVNPASTTAAVASSLSPSSSNQPVTLTATVSSGYAPPTGSVTFMYGSTSLGSATLTPGSGLGSTATLTTSTLPVGTDSITVVYAATANFGASTSSAFSQVVNTATSTTATATSSLNPATIGQSVTLTATLVGLFGAPTGSVSFMNGATLIGTMTLVPGSGLSSTATLSTTTLPLGADPITVVYTGTQNFGAATSPILSQVVSPAGTTTTVASSLNPANAGQSVTLTATVTSSGYAAPTGSVIFKSGATVIGSATLGSPAGLSSTATLTTSALPAGTDSITAVYAATTDFSGSTSAALSQAVNLSGTTAAVATSLSPASAGQPVTLTATLSSSTAAPTGSVVFMDGATAIGTMPLTATGSLTSTATLTTSTLPVGSNSITVVYAATVNFGAATSPVLVQMVNLAATATTASSSPGSSSYGQGVTFTATVSGSYAAPTGTVTFTFGGTTVGTAALSSSGGLSSTATLIASTLPVGADPITATYVPTGSFAASSGSFTQVVNGLLTTTTLTVSPNPAPAGQTVTLTAVVAGSSATPGGTVSFYSGSALLGTGTLNGSGTATFTSASLAAGTDSLTAAYSGSAIYTGSTSPAVSETIQGLTQNFTMALANPNLTIQTQNNATSSVTLTSQNGYADTLNLSCANLPTYITCSLTPSAIPLVANASAAVTLYIDTDSVLGYASNGNGPLGNRSSPLNLALMLSPVGLFAGLVAFPRGRSRRRTRLYLFLLLLAVVPMTLAFSGCGNPTPVAGVIPPSAATGTYTIPITATGSTTGTSHTVQLTLTVTQ